MLHAVVYELVLLSDGHHDSDLIGPLRFQRCVASNFNGGAGDDSHGILAFAQPPAVEVHTSLSGSGQFRPILVVGHRDGIALISFEHTAISVEVNRDGLRRPRRSDRGALIHNGFGVEVRLAHLPACEFIALAGRIGRHAILTDGLPRADKPRIVGSFGQRAFTCGKIDYHDAHLGDHAGSMVVGFLRAHKVRTRLDHRHRTVGNVRCALEPLVVVPLETVGGVAGNLDDRRFRTALDCQLGRRLGGLADLNRALDHLFERGVGCILVARDAHIVFTRIGRDGLGAPIAIVVAIGGAILDREATRVDAIGLHAELEHLRFAVIGEVVVTCSNLNLRLLIPLRINMQVADDLGGTGVERKLRPVRHVLGNRLVVPAGKHVVGKRRIRRNIFSIDMIGTGGKLHPHDLGGLIILGEGAAVGVEHHVSAHRLGAYRPTTIERRVFANHRGAGHQVLILEPIGLVPILIPADEREALTLGSGKLVTNLGASQHVNRLGSGNARPVFANVFEVDLVRGAFHVELDGRVVFFLKLPTRFDRRIRLIVAFAPHQFDRLPLVQVAVVSMGALSQFVVIVERLHIGIGINGHVDVPIRARLRQTREIRQSLAQAARRLLDCGNLADAIRVGLLGGVLDKVERLRRVLLGHRLVAVSHGNIQQLGKLAIRGRLGGGVAEDVFAHRNAGGLVVDQQLGSHLHRAAGNLPQRAGLKLGHRLARFRIDFRLEGRDGIIVRRVFERDAVVFVGVIREAGGSSDSHLVLVPRDLFDDVRELRLDRDDLDGIAQVGLRIGLCRDGGAARSVQRHNALAGGFFHLRRLLVARRPRDAVVERIGGRGVAVQAEGVRPLLAQVDHTQVIAVDGHAGNRVVLDAAGGAVNDHVTAADDAGAGRRALAAGAAVDPILSEHRAGAVGQGRRHVATVVGNIIGRKARCIQLGDILD